MSHFAKVVDGIVTYVCVADQEFMDTYDDGTGEGEWIQTSYNTSGGKHYAPNSRDEDGGVALRKNYAGPGYIYDKTRDAFYIPQPWPSWTLDEDTCTWEAPVPYPVNEEDENQNEYFWKEDILNWVVKVGQRGLADDGPADTSWIEGMTPEQIAQGKIDGNYSPIRWISDTEYVPLVKEK